MHHAIQNARVQKRKCWVCLLGLPNTKALVCLCRACPPTQALGLVTSHSADMFSLRFSSQARLHLLFPNSDLQGRAASHKYHCKSGPSATCSATLSAYRLLHGRRAMSHAPRVLAEAGHCLVEAVRRNWNTPSYMSKHVNCWRQPRSVIIDSHFCWPQQVNLKQHLGVSSA